jgi:hypothetical protein
MYLSVNDINKQLLIEEENLKELNKVLAFRKLFADQPIERLEYEIRVCKRSIEMWSELLNERLQGA